MATQPLSTEDAAEALPWGRPERVAFAALLAFAAALRVWLCLFDDGIYWPDEIYQSLEPAHRLVFGYGLIPWEFIEGARNWTFPALVAVVLKFAALVGGDDPRRYLVGVRLVFAAIGMLTSWGVYCLARTYRAPRVGAALGAVLFALAPASIYFAPRALSETASACAVVFGLALGLRSSARHRDVLPGASLLGLAVLLRLQNGIFCIALVLIWFARRRWRAAAEAAVTACAWGVLFGLIDRLTWGDWFHSAIAYLRFNLVEGRAARWGVAENTFYVRVLWTSMPVVTALAAALFVVAGRRALGPWLASVAFIVFHSLVAHKEYRFILPAFPVVFALAGVGFGTLVLATPRAYAHLARWPAAVFSLCAAVAGARFHRLTFGDLGQYEHERPTVSAYDDFGPVNRLLLVAHAQADLCGIQIPAAHLAWTGGSTYLHRAVPIYSGGTGFGHFNYVITPATPDAPGVVASEAGLALVRVGPRCARDFGYAWRLP